MVISAKLLLTLFINAVTLASGVRDALELRRNNFLKLRDKTKTSVANLAARTQSASESVELPSWHSAAQYTNHLS